MTSERNKLRERVAESERAKTSTDESKCYGTGSSTISAPWCEAHCCPIMACQEAASREELASLKAAHDQTLEVFEEALSEVTAGMTDEIGERPLSVMAHIRVLKLTLAAIRREARADERCVWITAGGEMCGLPRSAPNHQSDQLTDDRHTFESEPTTSAVRRVMKELVAARDTIALIEWAVSKKHQDQLDVRTIHRDIALSPVRAYVAAFHSAIASMRCDKARGGGE